MNSTVTPYPASVLEVSQRGIDCLVSEQSWARLASTEWARIGFTTYDGVQILPVRYVLEDHALVFSTPADGVLAQLADLTCRVACEVDRHTAASSVSWHVLMHGMITHRPAPSGESSPGSEGTVTLQFVPATMAGHRF